MGGALWPPAAVRDRLRRRHADGGLVRRVRPLVDSRTLTDSSGPLLEVAKAGGVDFPPKPSAPIALSAVTDSALINLMTASRPCCGTTDERVPPPATGKAPASRRTPWAGIAPVSVLAAGPVSTGGTEGLGDTTSFLPLGVFGVLGIAVPALRKDRAGHPTSTRRRIPAAPLHPGAHVPKENARTSICREHVA